MEHTKILLTFSIFGSTFNPAELTGLVAIKPTSQWFEGDEINGKPNFRRNETNWSYSIDYTETRDFGNIAAQLLEKFENKTDILKRFIDSHNLSAKIDIVIDIFDEEKPALYFEKNLLHFISTIDGEIDVNLHLLSNS